MPYRSLDPQKIIETVRVLHHRIDERFPNAGLVRVCEELLTLAETGKRAATQIERPVLPLRIASSLLIVLIVMGLAVTVYRLSVPPEPITFADFVQLLEAGINDLVLISIGVFFLITLERRHKRRRVLRAIHELRSIAHIVDMHQLTKDPAHTIRSFRDTPSSPRRTLSTPDLTRYLDYCAEMLSLTGKIAALYVERFDDSVVLSSVNEVETLTTSLAGKIWQKLMILESAGGSAAGTVGSPPPEHR